MSAIQSERILFIGDSITECYRSEREHHFNQLGYGYVSFIYALLQATYPSKHYKVSNKGIGGKTPFATYKSAGRGTFYPLNRIYSLS